MQENQPRNFLSFFNAKLYLTMDALERASDGLERDTLQATDIEYALAQMERVSGNVIMVLRMLRTAKKMFGGTPKANAWKECSPALPWMQDESEALDSLKASIDAWRARN
jgi:hypothetical protein